MSCAVFLAAAFLGAILADVLTPWSYEVQSRESPNAPPSRQHPLGTDDLGRDRLSRLLYGSRTSLLLAPAAALLAVGLAALAGSVAALVRGPFEAVLVGATDLTMSLPWLFLLLAVRAALPLNVRPAVSVAITFCLLGLLGWAGPARVVRTGVREILSSEYVLAASSRGVGRGRIVFRHVLPNLTPVLAAQFWTSVPVFILAEANLGMLGLGVSEPLPSWGSLLRELEGQSSGWTYLCASYWLLAPLATLVLVVLSCHVLFHAEVSQ